MPEQYRGPSLLALVGLSRQPRTPQEALERRSSDASFGQHFCVRAALSDHRNGSLFNVAANDATVSLAGHVAHVLSRSTEKQVIGTDARGVITAMADMHAGRYRTVVDDPRGAVSEFKAFASTPSTDGPVPIAVSLGSPDPAVFRSGDFLPESFRKRADLGSLVTPLRAVGGSPTLRGRGRNGDCGTAVATGKLNLHQEDSLVSGPGCWRTPGPLAVEILP